MCIVRIEKVILIFYHTASCRVEAKSVRGLFQNYSFPHERFSDSRAPDAVAALLSRWWAPPSLRCWLAQQTKNSAIWSLSQHRGRERVNFSAKPWFLPEMSAPVCQVPGCTTTQVTNLKSIPTKCVSKRSACKHTTCLFKYCLFFSCENY